MADSEIDQLRIGIERLRAMIRHDTQVMNDQTTGSYFVLQENERLREAIRIARQFLITGGPESIAECDGGAWDAAETLRIALGAS